LSSWGAVIAATLSALPLTRRTAVALLGAAALALGLVVTNPGPRQFEEFAGEELASLLSEELCTQDGLPLLARILIRDCEGLIASQRLVLGRLALRQTRRINLGLCSIYRTELGGEEIVPGWRLPRYSATTLAGAGQFVILRTDEESAEEKEDGPSAESG
jgi:hypothetical protein